MTIVLNGTTGITNDGGYTGDGVVFADTTPANTLVTTTGGNVGIGTSSPGAKLAVVSGVEGESLVYNNTNSSVTAANKFGYVIQESGSTVVSLRYRRDGTGTAELFNQSSILAFGTNNTERARIDSSGNLLVGTTTAVLTTTKLAVDTGSSVAAGVFRINGTSNTNLYVCNQSNSAFQAFSFRVNTSTEVGAINCTTTATTYVTSSDYRLKESVQPMVGALSVVQQLKPCTYTWKADGSAGQGFIAHELQAVVPDAVVGEKDAVETYTDEEGVEKTRPKYQGIDTSFLVATLTAAIQELKAIVDAQGAEIAALKGTQP